MASAFSSFNASNLGAFTQSLLLARNYQATATVVSVGVSVSSAAVMALVNGTGAWTLETSASATQWADVTYNSTVGLFVCVGLKSGGSYCVATSPDGVTWTGRTAAEINSWQTVAYGNGIYASLASQLVSGTHYAQTSPDGITWTSQTVSHAGAHWSKLCYGASQFVGIGYNLSGSSGADVLVTSPDGVTWTSRVNLNGDLWEGICYGAAGYCAVGVYNGGGCVCTSTDGINWYAQTASILGDWYDICYAPTLGLYIAVGSAGIMTCPSSSTFNIANSVTWTTRQSGASGGFGPFAVCWSGTNALLYGVNAVTANVVTSPDGINWTAGTAPTETWEAVVAAA